MQTEVSIIIISYNTRALLDKCLASIALSKTNVSYEVIVVDNDSKDGSVELVREKFPETKLIENKTNVGFARANNQALKICSGAYAVLLNSDTEVLGAALDTMHAFMVSHPDAGIVGAQLLNSDGTLQPSGNKVPSLTGEILQMTVLPLRRLFGLQPTNRFFDPNRDYSRVELVDEVSGACLMTRREVWKKIGPLDEGFFFYYEDVDFCTRARASGWKVYYVPSAQVLHHWGSSTNSEDRKFSSKMVVSYFYFIRKTHGIWGEAVMRTIVVGTAAAKFAIGLVGSLLQSAKCRKLALLNRDLLLASLRPRVNKPHSNTVS